MSGSDSITGIEDEPYQGLYHGVSSPKLDREPDHLPDRFDLAEILKSTRESRRLTLDKVAEITRVRKSYLEALEQAAYDVLPPRAFAIGYVKAYAKALGLDEETLADMFKRDVAAPQARLHAPTGASLDDVKPSYGRYIAAALGLVGLIVVWNVVQHRPTGARTIEQQFDAVAWTNTVPLIREGLVVLTKPAPAPRDQDIPPPYVTPGLEEGFASIAAASNRSGSAPVPVQDVVTARGFNPRGAIYGAQPENSDVTLQATRTTTLTLRDSAGIVHFIQTFSPGEAFRLPSAEDQNLILDAPDFKAFEIYYNGEYAGVMDGAKLQIGQVNARAAQMAGALDTRQSTTTVATDTPPPPPEAPVLLKKSDQPIPYLPAVRPAAAPASPVVVPAASSSAATVPAPAASSSSDAPQ